MRTAVNAGTPCRRVALGALALALVLGTGAALLAADYEIGPGDVLKVIVVGQAEMTGSFAVDTEGMVNFPVLGKIKASEHTTAELERKLTTLLADGYLKRPQVTVSVGEFGSQKVFVTGEVQRPGQYPLKSDRSLLALLGDLGPLGTNAGHEVFVVRPPTAPAAAAAGPGPADTPAEDDLFPAGTNPDTTAPPEAAPDPAAVAPAAPATPVVPGLPYVAPGSEVYRINLLELQSGNPGKNILLRASDTVYFPRAAQVYVMGSVARPGPYRYQDGMTVLQALTQAGGVTDRGSSGRTKFIRIENGKKVERKAKATDLVLPEDTLYVPERFF